MNSQQYYNISKKYVMLAINTDAYLEIGNFLLDREKIYLTMTCKMMDRLKSKFMYCQKMQRHNIAHLPFFDNFECVKISNLRSRCPKYAKYIYFMSDSSRALTNNTQKITHLQFTRSFNQPLKNRIPSSVTHLTFGKMFDRSIRGDIPANVTHLEFGFYFNRSINNSIPSSVTHLTFGHCFNKSINNIPDSVIEIRISKFYPTHINKNLLSKIIRF